MRGKDKFLLLVFSFGCCFGSVAQEWDLTSWTKVRAKGDLTKKLGLSIEQQVRLRDNSSSLDQTFTEIGLSYDLPKGFGLTAEYRLGFEPISGGGMSSKHRYNLDLTYSKKFWKLRAKVRARFQHAPNASLYNERLKPDGDPMNVRLKISLSYNDLKRWTPGIAYEVYFLTNDPEKNGANKFRYRVFLDHKISKRHGIGAFYMVQTAYAGRTPQFDSVVGLNYTYTWKRPKKKNPSAGQAGKKDKAE